MKTFTARMRSSINVAVRAGWDARPPSGHKPEPERSCKSSSIEKLPENSAVYSDLTVSSGHARSGACAPHQVRLAPGKDEAAFRNKIASGAGRPPPYGLDAFDDLDDAVRVASIERITKPSAWLRCGRARNPLRAAGRTRRVLSRSRRCRSPTWCSSGNARHRG